MTLGKKHSLLGRFGHNSGGATHTIDGQLPVYGSIREMDTLPSLSHLKPKRKFRSSKSILFRNQQKQGKQVDPLPQYQRLGQHNYYLPASPSRDLKKLQKLEKKIQKKHAKVMKKQLKKSRKHSKKYKNTKLVPPPAPRNAGLTGTLAFYLGGSEMSSQGQYQPGNQFGLRRAGKKTGRRVRLLKRLLHSSARSHFLTQRQQYPYMMNPGSGYDANQYNYGPSFGPPYHNMQENIVGYSESGYSEWEDIVNPLSYIRKIRQYINPMDRVRARLLNSYVYRKRDVVASLTKAPIKMLIQPDKSVTSMLKIWIDTVQVPLMWMCVNRNSKARRKTRNGRISHTNSRLSRIPDWTGLEGKVKKSRLRKLIPFQKSKKAEPDWGFSTEKIPSYIFAVVRNLVKYSQQPSPKPNSPYRQRVLNSVFDILKQTNIAGSGKVVKNTPKSKKNLRNKVGVFVGW